MELGEKAIPNDVADVFLQEVWQHHWLPTEIISDIDEMLEVEFRESLC